MTDLKSIEQQISQLIGMVAKNNEMLYDLKSQFEQEREVNQARSQEILKEIRNQKYVINHHRDKIAKNEEELSTIKQMMQS